jgi:hypothetical protein
VNEQLRMIARAAAMGVPDALEFFRRHGHYREAQ